jgi:sigma-B regulation protein RsbU (phosphoserine phosphatase)
MTTTTLPFELHIIERQREEELEEARAIQSMMLPAEMLQAGGVTFAHEFLPIASVGGDFVDYFQLSDESFGLYLGDVSGKGLPAALYAALAVGTLRGVHKTGTPPHDVLGTLNKRLMLRGMPRRHTAIQYALFHPQISELQVASAGMPGPLLISKEGCRILEIHGIPPGLFAATRYDTLSVRMEPGDTMLFCTDGITDAFNCAGEQFGLARLKEECEAVKGEAPGELLKRVFAAVAEFSKGREQHDDMAAAVFHFLG